jgi:hypothetical protein
VSKRVTVQEGDTLEIGVAGFPRLDSPSCHRTPLMGELATNRIGRVGQSTGYWLLVLVAGL